MRKRCQRSELYRQYLLHYVTATDVRSEAYGLAAASYDRNDVFFCQVLAVFVCYHFLFDDRNGLLGGQKLEEMLSQVAC